MSAFLVSKETINKVCAAMTIDSDGLTDEQLDDLGVQLLLMNHKALLARYGDVIPPPDQRTFTFKAKNYNRAEMVKALGCLRYQCCEGDVDECSLYKKVEACRERLDEPGLSESPEYEDAEWG